MYNNIGLQTPRGSGTSGYVSANKARPRQTKSRLEFLKELKQYRENILPEPRKANKDILEHKQKREIYVKLAELRARLQREGLDEKNIEERAKTEERELLDKYSRGEFNKEETGMGKDSHALALVKEKEQAKLKGAFKIKEGYEFGSAFDFDNQEKQRLERIYQREVKKMEHKKKEKEERKKAKKREREREEERNKERNKKTEKKELKKKRTESNSSSISVEKSPHKRSSRRSKKEESPIRNSEKRAYRKASSRKRSVEPSPEKKEKVKLQRRQRSRSSSKSSYSSSGSSSSNSSE